MHHVVVDLQNHSPVYKDWLPFIGSIVIGLLAFGGVLLSNHTNRKAIIASDEREFIKWKREAVLRVCSEALENALHAEGDYMKYAYMKESTEELAVTAATAIDSYGRKIGASTAALRMLSAHSTADACAAVRGAVNSEALVRTFVDYMGKRHLARGEAKALELPSFKNSENSFRAELDRITTARERLISASELELARLAAEAQVKPRRP